MHLQMPSTPLPNDSSWPLWPLHKSPQAAAEEELAPLQRVLLVFLHSQVLAATELAGHSLAVIVAVSVLKMTACAEQRPVQLQHGTARPAAHQESHMKTGQHWHLQKNPECSRIISKLSSYICTTFKSSILLVHTTLTPQLLQVRSLVIALKLLVQRPCFCYNGSSLITGHNTGFIDRIYYRVLW